MPSRPVGFLLTAAVVLAGAGYDYARLETNQPLAFGWEPTPVDWLFLLSVALFGWFVVVPLVRNRERTARYWSRLRADPLALGAALYLFAFFLAGTVGPALVDASANSLEHAYQPPVLFSVSDHVPPQCLGAQGPGTCHGTWQYPFGTDAHGNGILALVVLGAGVSLRVAFVVGALAVPLALAVGVVAGFVGGRVDSALMRYVDVQGTVPAFLVYVISIYVFGRSLFVLVVVFGLLSWGGIARIVRSEVLQLRNEGYVLASLVQGAGRLEVMRRHVLPNVFDNLAVSVTQAVPRILLAEAAISFMLLNDIGVPSWGHTATMGLRHQYQFVHTWWISTLPIAFLALTVVSFALLGDFFRDALDPTGG
ncbi:MAG: ABC transporter permease [Haloferacaceae archaeon]